MNNKVEHISDTISKSEALQNKNDSLDQAIKKSSVNVKELETLYKKNYILKQQIDKDKRALKHARETFEIEMSQKYKELNQYKKDMTLILEKNRKEIAKEREQLTIEQEELDKNRKAFEVLKKRQQMNFKLRKDKQAALLDTKKNELESIELNLKLKKEKIESLRKTLEYDMIEFEAKKRELANNLERFNSLVVNIGNGMSRLKEKNTVSDKEN